MKIVSFFFWSDPHNRSRFLGFPKADYYICTGDATNFGTEKELKEFNRIVGEQKKKKKFKKMFFVPGNHEVELEENFASYSKFLNKMEILIDKTIVLDCGLKIHGTPYVPTFFDWAYMKSEIELGYHWNLIPNDVDILLTHGPPFGILDPVMRFPFHAGSKTLRQKIDYLVEKGNLMLHLFGHIHEGRGIADLFKTTFVNGSVELVPSVDPVRQFAALGYLIKIDADAKKIVSIDEVN